MRPQHPSFAKLRKASCQPPTFRLLPSTANRNLLNVMPPWFALVCNKLPTGLGIWSQRGARSMTQLARSPSGTPPLWTYTTKPRCPTHGGLLRIRSHASTTSKLRKATQSQRSTTNIQTSPKQRKPQSAQHDASMVCPCVPLAAHKARNMEPARCKEHVRLGRHHCGHTPLSQGAQLPNTWWAAEDTQPCVHNMQASQSYAKPAVNHQHSDFSQALQTAICST